MNMQYKFRVTHAPLNWAWLKNNGMPKVNQESTNTVHKHQNNLLCVIKRSGLWTVKDGKN